MSLKSFLFLLLLAASAQAETLWDIFVSPPDEAKTKVWWFHGETETTHEGIDADLEAFKEAGVGGVVFYDQVHGKCAGAVPSMSPAWWESLRYAAGKAGELGLTFEVAASNGYVTGGPWITEEFGMKKTVWLDTLINITKGGEIYLPIPAKGFRDVATLAFPDTPDLSPIAMHPGALTVGRNDTIIYADFAEPVTLRAISYTLTPRGKGSTGSMNIPGKPQNRYFGAMYIDYPPVGQLEYTPDGLTWLKAADLLPLENNIGHKSRSRTISFPAVTASRFRLNIHDWQGDDDRYPTITLGDVTLHRRDMIHNAEVQNGLRTEVTYPAMVGGSFGAITPSEIVSLTDRMRGDTLKAALSPGTWRILRFGYAPTGAKTKHGRKNLLGLEADVMSSEAAEAHFRNYFGAVLDSLAAIGCTPAGMAQDSHEAGTQNWTKGFVSIFEEKNSYSLLPYLPALAGYVVDSRESSDRVLADFRSTVASTIRENYYGTLARLCRERGVDYTAQGMLNILTDNIGGRGMASKPQGEFWWYQSNGNYDCLDAASAAHLYAHPIASAEAFTDTPYSATWDELERIANIAWCRGINEFVVCASSYQPWLDRKYDDSASAHPYVFHRHHPDWAASKSFWEYQARCAAMLRQGRPVVDLAVYLGDEPPYKTMAYRLPLLPEGYNFDVFTPDVLHNRLSVSDGEIAVEGGMSYRAIVVPAKTPLSETSEARLDSVARIGARVIREDRGEVVADRLTTLGIEPDITLESADEPDDKVLFFHRTSPEADIYFVYNHSPRPYDKPVRLRVPGSAELWNPKTLQRTPLNGLLHLSPHEATFIIINK